MRKRNNKLLLKVYVIKRRESSGIEVNMNEVLLINMIGQLSPELLQDNYMEKEMKKSILSFLGKILKKLAKLQYGNSFFQSISYKNEYEESAETDNINNLNADTYDSSVEDKEEYDLNTRGLSIRIFKKNFRNIIKIISGIAATFVVILSIIIILIVRHKSCIKLLKKNIQVIY